jgi:hypothetical protein
VSERDADHLIDIAPDGCQDHSLTDAEHSPGLSRREISPGVSDTKVASMRSDSSEELTREELAWELVEIFDELGADQINEMLAKNVPLETLEFFASYVEESWSSPAIDANTRKRLPNLMLLGYLLRVLEERLLPEPGRFDA